MQRIATQSTDSVQGGHDTPVTECRALAVVTPAVCERGEIARPYRSAAFVAQLLAAKARLPQSRERRREEPDVVMHVYEVGMAPLPPSQGRLFSRAM
jgi:hypothetical protein